MDKNIKEEAEKVYTALEIGHLYRWLGLQTLLQHEKSLKKQLKRHDFLQGKINSLSEAVRNAEFGSGFDIDKACRDIDKFKLEMSTLNPKEQLDQELSEYLTKINKMTDSDPNTGFSLSIDQGLDILNHKTPVREAVLEIAREKGIPIYTGDQKITFGSYPHTLRNKEDYLSSSLYWDVRETHNITKEDRDQVFDKQPIEWLLLDFDDSRFFIISKEPLDYQRYHNTEQATGNKITWEKCTLRNWLNSEFLKDAFSQNEQDNIQKLKVVSNDLDTDDQVSLLSESEVTKYFPFVSDRKCSLNEYIMTVHNPRGRDAAWFTRTSFEDKVRMLDDRGYFIDLWCGSCYAVRPSMWIDCK